MFASFITTDDPYDMHNKSVNIMNNINFNEPETPAGIFSDINQKAAPLSQDETMKIFLRFRPLLNKNIASPYAVINNYTVTSNPPEQSASYKNLLHGNGKGYQKFIFSKVFHGDSVQKTVFDETTDVLLNDFIRGNDRLLFTYGTTSSGKTFTMNGSKSKVGIIPRSLCRLFKSTKLSNDSSLMPVDFAEICPIKKPDVAKILKEKSILLKLSEKETSELLNVFDRSKSASDCENVSESEIDENLVRNDDYEVTFWISYTEIYNEFIYDLLDTTIMSTGGNNGGGNFNKIKRPILDIKTSRSGGSYVKGLKSYPVFSAEEAYRLLLVGRRNQSMGATKLNANSSRSHTILTIRAVRTKPGSEYLTRVCNLCFCDLAGSERTDKAQTSGLSQKEAANINTSLLTLGRCMETLRHNQANQPYRQQLVPYRDSKLTRLFQTYLGGIGKASMIVCINQDPGLFDETLQVLKFSALAKKIVIREKDKSAIAEPKPVDTSKRRVSIYKRLGMRSPMKSGGRVTLNSFSSDEEEEEQEEDEQDDPDETMHQESSEEELEEEYDVKELLDVIERLKAELISTRKEKVANEVRLRETIHDEWSKTIMQMERDNARNIENLRNQMQEEIKKRTRNERNKAYMQLKKRKLQPEFDDDSDEQERSVNEDSEKLRSLKVELSCQTKEIETLKCQLKEAEEESAEMKETLEILAQEKDLMEIHCRELEFQVSQLQITVNKTKSKKVETNSTEVQTNTMELSILEESSSDMFDECPVVMKPCPMKREVISRFSTISTNPKIKEIQKLEESKKLPNNRKFFDPITTPAKFKSSEIEAMSTVKKNAGEHKNLFTIFINEDHEDEDNGEMSFLKHEKECATVAELETTIRQLQDELCAKVCLIKDQQEQLELFESEIQSLTVRLIAREKTIAKMSDKENNFRKRLDNILGQLDLENDIETLRTKEKLKLISKTLQKIQSGFDQINLVIPSNTTGVLHDSTNARLSSDTSANHVVAHIKQLESQLSMLQDDYQQIVSICNESFIDPARSCLGMKIKRISCDTPLSDICTRFQDVWSRAVDKIASLSVSMDNMALRSPVDDKPVIDQEDATSQASESSTSQTTRQTRSQSSNSSEVDMPHHCHTLY